MSECGIVGVRLRRPFGVVAVVAFGATSARLGASSIKDSLPGVHVVGFLCIFYLLYLLTLRAYPATRLPALGRFDVYPNVNTRAWATAAVSAVEAVVITASVAETMFANVICSIAVGYSPYHCTYMWRNRLAASFSGATVVPI